ncbi:hypothetical protein QFZ37_003157 [Chryseobacterium ginsenosidimutans]|uniref:hypothetical protein n=1 Tax=Chryseobacterium ginsenosidimutans TaxID=687846 RepID=UPI00278635C6|nr:hypothetical protein [Chryseobacterium ginsenosidimutans]MDQ0594788.1 hypothetical protein [Chryseobacterium ginsenosidimutans]
MIKNKLLIGFGVLLIFGLVYYFYTPDISKKDMIYFENAKDSIIKNHEYFMTHNLEPISNPSDKIIFSRERGFVTNESYFNLLKQKDGKVFLNPINILFTKGLISKSNKDFSLSYSLIVNQDSTIQFITYEKHRLEGCKIGYLLYDPKNKLKIEKGYGHYDIKFKKNGWRYIKAVEPYFSND